jgi:hypothetical protein
MPQGGNRQVDFWVPQKLGEKIKYIFGEATEMVESTHNADLPLQWKSS